ncbi:dihydroxyacetone kinase [Paenibacillus montanisoli]|uniref:Dihydroxyacetone kinase n=2 Tax=Paenibacillus montanisoli TaxID=2081970 RepID=A0A328U2Q0_9BACL|nr:dihydroxyacetone kinase subunit DhaK [Paenibacillus montanisoli]RAP76919.1 dihydroxyacetone kinase [Paenibacillus montanisoli]
MKKLINDPLLVTDELVEGLVLAHRKKLRKLDDMNVVVRTDVDFSRKTGVVIGGGSGHEPLFLGFVGRGMGDSIAHGDIFTSPSVDVVYEAIKAADGGNGVVLIYGNYMGDILNFDMAQELARAEGMRVETVRVWDDIASAPPEKKDERRGTSADVFVIKIAGAASELGMSFDNVLRAAEKARDQSRSLGVSLSSCTLPAVGKPIFELEKDMMMIGMGVHGEPGIEKTKLLSADETADVIFSRLLDDDLALQAGDEIALLVNGYGATTMMELYIVNRRLHQLFEERGIGIYGNLVGNYCTSQEMAGCSVTMMKLDDELKMLYDQPAESPGLTLF